MTDLQHFTSDEVADALAEAKKIVVEAELPGGVTDEAILWVAQKLCEKTIMHGPPTLMPAMGRLQ